MRNKHQSNFSKYAFFTLFSYSYASTSFFILSLQFLFDHKKRCFLVNFSNKSSIFTFFNSVISILDDLNL